MTDAAEGFVGESDGRFILSSPQEELAEIAQEADNGHQGYLLLSQTQAIRSSAECRP
ncbi:MAG: hypothetical protein AMXMBFR57_04630 [Acidimicrobiia bacterium]